MNLDSRIFTQKKPDNRELLDSGSCGQRTMSGSLNLFHNDGDLTFTEVAAIWGLHHTGQGRGLMHFDYHNDGDQDLAIFTKDERIRLFRNDLAAPDRHWLGVLLDTRTRPDLAPDCIGARVIVLTAAPARR